MSAEPDRETPEPTTEPVIPEPPWLKPPRTTRARAPLSREVIVDAALRLLDREGASGLSMRRLADELGSGAGAIYWHVANKEQLIQLMFDRVIGDLPLPDVDPSRWQEQIKQAARDARASMTDHPGLAELSFGRIPLGPNAVRYFEWHLSVLRAGGLPDRVAALAGDLIYLYVDSFSFEECVGVPPPSGEGSSPADFIGELRAYLASLPADRFPNITELADALTTGGSDERFEFGLDILVAGLAAHARKS
jgi:TetR/AcrR family transcriptional regulator, tetracycline repressor protein